MLLIIYLFVEYSQPDKLGGTINQLEYENGLIAAVNKFCNQILIFDSSNGIPDLPAYIYNPSFLEMYDICLSEHSIVSCSSYSQTSIINFETFEVDLFNQSNSCTKFITKLKLTINISPSKIVQKLVKNGVSIQIEPTKFNKILSIVNFIGLFKKEGVLPDFSKVSIL